MKKITLLCFLLSNVNIVNAEEWFSVARHGECVPLFVLAENIKEFKGVATPDKLIKSYLNSGHQAEMGDFREVVIKAFGDDMTAEQKKTLPPKGASYQIIVDGIVKWTLLEKAYCREFLKKQVKILKERGTCTSLFT
ncbi:ISPpu15, transposase Orf2 [Moritella viscosa]|uniref:hypothetical protein n=1 Tax=Moritella viscosa TaxID=80854 RepID=UPI00091D5FC8|nr:hypothetical protein [Moritella viscosa]SGZ06377.1 ISPpu15, transposase Orf2 [Moritella viscosa]